MPPKIPSQLGFSRQAHFLRGHKPCVQLLSNQPCHPVRLLSFRWQWWEPWLWAAEQLWEAQASHMSAAEQLHYGSSWIIIPTPLLVPEGVGDCSLASIWRSSWMWHAKGKNSSGAKRKISQQDSFYARKCYQPKSHRVSLTSNSIIQIPFQRRSFSPWRKGWWPAAL